MTAISYSTMGFMNKDFDNAVDAVAQAGFRHVELLSMAHHLPQPPTGAALQALRQRLDRAAFLGCTVHGPFQNGEIVGAVDPELRRKSVTATLSFIAFAGALGARGLVLHPVPRPADVRQLNLPDPTAAIRDACRRTLDALIPAATAAGVRLLLENLPFLPALVPLTRMRDLRALIEDYPAATVGLIVDIGHSRTIGEDPAADIRDAGDRLHGTHLQDVAAIDPTDNHWPPGHGAQDWAAVRQALVDVRYAGHWTFEVGRGRQGEDHATLAATTRAFAETWAPNRGCD